MCSHSSPERERRTVPLKRSTADSSIYAGPRWDSATSRITSRGVCSSPVASDRFYTLNYDEPRFDSRDFGQSGDEECHLVLIAARTIAQTTPAQTHDRPDDGTEAAVEAIAQVLGAAPRS